MVVLHDQNTVSDNSRCFFMSHTYGKTIARVVSGARLRYPGVRVLFGFFLRDDADPWIILSSCPNLAGELMIRIPSLNRITNLMFFSFASLPAPVQSPMTCTYGLFFRVAALACERLPTDRSCLRL